MSREIYSCPHCHKNAKKISEDEHYIKILCKSCDIEIELDKVDLEQN